MAVAAQQVRVQRHGDAVVGEQTQSFYDEETGSMCQKRTTLAQVPTDEGEDTVVLEEVTHLERNPDSNVDASPSYTARKFKLLRVFKSSSYNVSKKSSKNSSKCDTFDTLLILSIAGWIIGVCCFVLMSLAIIISTAAVGLVSCSDDALRGLGIFGIILGILACLMSPFCAIIPCLCVDEFRECNKYFCCTLSILLMIFIGIIGTHTSFVAGNLTLIYSDDACGHPIAAVAAMGMSYVILLIIGPSCVASAGKLAWDKCTK